MREVRDIEGVCVASVTPLEDGGSYETGAEAYLSHVSWLAERSVRSVVSFGANGEGTLCRTPLVPVPADYDPALQGAGRS